MPYCFTRLASMLVACRVKRVIMRYDGREGRANVQSVNFLSEMGSFLTNADIKNARLPENEFYALGLEILDRAKKTWADDWGGKGALTWETTGHIEVFHQDREILEIYWETEIPQSQLRNAIQKADLPNLELDLISKIQCDFSCHEKSLQFGMFIVSPEDENILLSSKLHAGLGSLFNDAVSLSTKNDIELETGRIHWTLGDAVRIELTGNQEKYTQQYYSIPLKDLTEIEI